MDEQIIFLIDDIYIYRFMENRKLINMISNVIYSVVLMYTISGYWLEFKKYIYTFLF